jgi:DNA-binding NarL/FixJ family response regulator
MFRIVIADPDELSTLRLMTALSGVDGLDVVGTASDGAQALELVRHLKPDVVLLDLSVPPLGGLALISAIKHALPGTRVLVIVGGAREATVESAVSAGASGFLVKETPTEQTPTGLRLLVPEDDTGGPPSARLAPERPHERARRARCYRARSRVTHPRHR